MLTKTISESKKKQRNILIKAMNNDIGSIDSAKDSWNPAQISERAKDISYIRSLVDSWNPAQLNEALRMLDLPVIDTWNPAQIEEQRRNLIFYLAERTLTGDPITLKILGNLTPEVTGLKVTMLPIQSGTGDPSPTNVRPISGRYEVSVTRTAGEDVETKTHQYSETIYGGTDDFVNGGATNEWGILTPTSVSTMGGGSGTNIFFRINIPNSAKGINTASLNNQPISNYFFVDNTANHVLGGAFITSEGTSLHITFADQTIDTMEKANTYLSNNPLQICYKLATPTTISTSAEEIILLKGENVLSTDGDSIELKYKQNF